MNFGLEDNIIEKIIQVFEANSKVDKAVVFGSRAKGNYRLDSDIDIAVKVCYSPFFRPPLVVFNIFFKINKKMMMCKC